jgi:hypothetical protein
MKRQDYKAIAHPRSSNGEIVPLISYFPHEDEHVAFGPRREAF